MRSWRKFVATAGLCLLLNAGCAEEKKPASPIQQLQKSESAYENLEPLAEKVAGLSEKVFPEGGIINFGKTEEGLNRYLAILVLNENGVSALDLQLYMGSNPELEARVQESLLIKDYGPAIKALYASGWSMSEINDSKIDGINPADSGDFVSSRRDKGELSTLRSTELYKSLEAVNNLYGIILRKAVPILEERLKSKD